MSGSCQNYTSRQTLVPQTRDSLLAKTRSLTLGARIDAPRCRSEPRTSVTGCPKQRNIRLSEAIAVARPSAHHFADLRRQFGGSERLLQVVDFAVHQSVPENHLVGIAGHEEHLDLRPAGAQLLGQGFADRRE